MSDDNGRWCRYCLIGLEEQHGRRHSCEAMRIAKRLQIYWNGVERAAKRYLKLNPRKKKQRGFVESKK